MTNHLTKTAGSISVGQGNGVVGDQKNGPVCLDTVPRAHKHFPESEMLLDVLMESFDPDSLGIESDHLRFCHFEVVGNKEPDLSFSRFGNKQKNSSDSWQMDQALGDAKPLVFGGDGFVFSDRLGQETQRSFSSTHFDDAVSFDSDKENPSSVLNQIENRSAGIPGIHQDRHGDREFRDDLGKNFESHRDFAFESVLGTSAFGAITLESPGQTFRPSFDQGCNSTQSTKKSLGSVMKPDAIDFLSFSGTRRVVDNEHRGGRGADVLNDLPLVVVEKPLDFFGRSLDKLMKAVGIVLAEVMSNLADRTEFDQSNQTDKINQKIFSLRFVQNPQETRKVRRDFLGCYFAHGFRALLGLVSKGDFGRKPFYFQWLLSSYFLKSAKLELS